MGRTFKVFAPGIILLASYGFSGSRVRAASSHAHQGASARHLVFDNLASGELIDETGNQLGLKTLGREQTILGFIDFKASDGVRLTIEDGEFSAPMDAKRLFEAKIAQAKKIVQRRAVKDKEGKVTGERAEVMLQSAASKPKTWAVLWTAGPWFHEIISSSLKDCLVLEREYTGN